MLESSFGGTSRQERLATGPFGDVYRALGGAGKEVRLVEVAPELAAHPRFAAALIRFAEDARALDHPRVLGVREVLQRGDAIAVVTDPVSGPVALADLLARSRVPADVALAIGLGAIEGLAHAHRAGFVHGAVHPRSVLVDRDGCVILADFGLAWALVEAAAEADDSRLLSGLRGYLAPELALQQSATEASDVYAAGALLSELLHGDTGDIGATPEVGRAIGRALATDPDRRLADAGELEELLAAAIAADGCRPANGAQVAAFAANPRGAPEDPLHAATDDLLAELEAGGPVRAESLGDVLAGLEEESRAPDAARAPAMAAAPELAAAWAAPELRRRRPFLWIGATVFALGGLAAILYTGSDLFDPGREEAELRAAEAKRKEALARHEAEQPLPAELTVSAAEPDAAVWLLLGRTPLDSMPLSAAMVHELRLEHEGYRTLDVRVAGYQWKEDGGRLRAEVEAALEPGRGTAPAFPPAGTAAPPAGPNGRGVVRVRSQPAGAQVWLLIGFTPTATIAGLEAGRAYEIKALKDGFRPGFASVRAEDWYLSGPGGPILTSLRRPVSLSPGGDARQGKSRKRRSARGRP